MKKTALITGASSGIGYELAKLFARDGCDLVLVARSESKLVLLANELKSQHRISVKVLPKDLSLPGAPEEILAQLKNESIEVETLVNNAGVGTYGPFAEQQTAALLKMIQLNLVSLTHLTRLLLPAMVEKRKGRILNVASTAAFQPGPLMAVYYATKAYVLFFSEAIRNELRGTGVTVTALCPGPTRTGFQSAAGLGDSMLSRIGFRQEPGPVAEAGIRGLMRGQGIVVPGLSNKILYFLVRLVPRDWATAAVRRVQKGRSDGF